MVVRYTLCLNILVIRGPAIRPRRSIMHLPGGPSSWLALDFLMDTAFPAALVARLKAFKMWRLP